MAFNIQEARNEGYSDSEIAEYLAKQKKFNIESARKEGYYDDEIINHLVEEPQQQGPSFGDRLKTSFKNTASNMASTIANAGLSVVKGANNLNVADKTEYAPYTPNTGIQPTEIGNQAFEQTVSNSTQLKDPNAPAVLKAPEQPEVNFTNVVKGIAQSLPQGIESTKQGIRAQYADAIDSEAMASDAQLQAQRNRNDIQDSTPAFESATASGLYSGATSLIQQTPGLIASIATGNPAIALTNAGLTTEAEAYTRYRERGATPKEALTGAMGEGIVEVLTEAVPMKFLVDKFGKTGATKLVAGFIAKDAIPEQVATLTQDAIDTAIANPNKTWGDYLAERPDAAYQTLLATVVQAGAIGGAGYAANKLAGSDDQQKKLDKIKTLPTKNLETLRDTASKINPTDVPVIDEELNRRANLGTLTRAAEEAQRQGITQPQNEAIEASDLLEEDNVSTPVEQPVTDMATGSSGLASDNQLGSTADIALQPVTSNTLDSTQELEPSAGSDIPVGPTPSEPTASVDGDWQTFAPETQTLGIPRDEMPQIKAEHRGAMVNFLNARDITHEQETVPASSLKPTQQEFSLSKVQKARDFEGGNRSILISSDNHVLDGHHQWLSKLEGDQPIDVIRLNAPIADLIATVKEFPSATTESITSENVNTPQTAPALPDVSPQKKSRNKPSTLLATLRTIGGIRMGDKLDVTGQDKSFAPGGYNQVFTKASNASLRGHIESGSLDDYLPPNMRLSATTAQSEAYDSEQAYNYLADRIRNGEKVLPFDVEQEIKLSKQYENQSQQDDIDALEDFNDDEVNTLLQEAGYDEREQQAETYETGSFETPENIEQASASGDVAGSEGAQAGVGSATAGTSTVQSAPKQEGTDQRIRDQVESIVKRRAAANQLGKLKAFDLYLQTAKDFMNGGKPNTAKFTVAASIFKGDPALANAFNELKALAQPQAKAERKEKANTFETYKQIINDAKSVAELQAIAKDIQAETTLSDTKAAELDDFVMNRMDALSEISDDVIIENVNESKISEQEKLTINDAEVDKNDGPKATEKAPKITKEPSKQAVSEDGPDLLGDDTKDKQAIADAERARDVKRNTGNGDTEGFTLTGSDSEADKAAAAGAQDLFAQPAKKEVLKDTSDVGGEMAANRRAKGLSMDDIKNASNDTERVQMAVKAKLWEKPDYQALVDGGVQPVIAHVIKQVYDSLSTKPQYKDSKYLYAYVETVEAAKKAVDKLLSDKTMMDSMIVSIGVKASSQRMIMGGGKVDELRKFNDLKTKFDGNDPLDYLVNSVFPKNEQGARWGSKNPVGNDKANATGKRFYLTLQLGLNNFVDALKAIEQGFPAKREQWQISYRIENKNGKYELYKKGRYRVLSEHETEEQAIEAARELTKKTKEEAFKEPETPVQKSTRKGEPIREGNVSSQELKEAIGLKAVNFGNWMAENSNAKERQAHVNSAYDAFHDLASILNLPIKAMSLNGSLGLAIGAQGSGKAAAHFIAGVNEINLTRGSGAGSLAHEWAHALDHYFGVQSGMAMDDQPFASWLGRYPSTKTKGKDIRPEIVDAIRTIYDTMKGKVESADDAKVRHQAGYDAAKKRLLDYVDGAKSYIKEGTIKDAVKGDAVAEKALTEILDGNAGQIVILPPKKGKRKSEGNLYENVKIVTDKLGWDYEESRNLNSMAGSFDYSNELLKKEPQLRTIHTDFYKNANLLDGGKQKPYWSTPHELFARAFEMYVADKIAEKGGENNYLVAAWKLAESADVTDPLLKSIIAEADKRYPRNGEREAINKAFDTLFAEIKTKEADDGNVVMFSRATAQNGLPKDTVQTIVDNIKSKWKNAPPIYVVESMQDEAIPKHVREYDMQLKDNGATGDPIGFISGGKVFILSTMVKDTNAVHEVLFHEALGHYGLRGVYGNALETILDQIVMARSKEVIAKAREYGFDIKSKSDLRKAAEEVLAEMAQTKPELGFVKRAIAAIRKFLRDIGFDIKLSDADIIANYLLPARDYVVNGGKEQRMPSGLKTAYSRADQSDDNTMFSRAHNTSDIPDAIILNPLGTAKNNADYELAKSGDVEAATRLAKTLVTGNVIKNLKESIKNADLIVGVTSVEQSGNNALPEAAAILIAEKLGIKYDQNVLQSTSPKRTGMNGLDRIFSRPVFDGDVVKDAGYIFVDDTITQGGTFAALSFHIKDGGGKVVANIALTGKEYSSKIAISNDQLMRVREKFGDLENEFKQITGYGFDGLTSSEARYVTLGITSKQFRDRIIAESEKATRSSNQETTQSEVNPKETAFSRTQERLLPTWETLEDSKIDNLIRTFQDKQIDLKRVTQAIKKTGVELANRFDAYLQEELYHGRTAKRVDDFVKSELDPLINQMRDLDVSMESLEEYLWMRHAEERNIQNAKVNPDMPDGGSGKTTAEARAYLAGLSAEQKQKFEALAKRVDAISAKNKQTLIDYNLESPSTIEAWGKTYKHYVPLMRDEMDLGFGMGTGQGFSVKGSASKRAIGSNLKVVNILANLAEQRERYITRGEKNRVATALIGMAKLNPNEDFWEVDKPPRIKAISKVTGLAEEYTDPNYKSRPNVVVARIKNKQGEIEERSVVFNEFDERAMSMAAAIKNLDVEQMEKALGYVSHVTRYFASVNTQYNPIFGVLNILRDVQGSLLNLSTTPLKDYSKAKILKDTGAAMAGIYKEMRSVRKGDGTVDSEWSKLWEEFQKVGGKTGYRDMFANATDRTEALKKALDPEWWTKTKVGKVVSAGGLLTQSEMLVKDKAIKPVFDWLSDYNETLENSVRLSVYKAGLDKGLTKQEAASIAKNISVNFNRKGNMGRTIGALYAFFNAAVQGNARIIETLKGPAGKKIIYGGLMLGSMQALLLAAYGYDDDEPPEFIRNRNIIIPLDIVGVDKKYVSIPMPLGFNAIPNVGRIITETVLSGGDHFGKRLEGLFTMLMDTTNPIGGSGSLMSIVTPTALDPINDLDKNKDWTGQEISKEDSRSTNPTPGYTRSKDKAWNISIELARYINNLSGGTDYKQGVFSPTADEIEYLAGQVGGGVSREIIKAGTTVDSLITGEDLPSHKIPLAGRFYGDAAGQAAQGATFYENIRKLNEHEAEIKGRRKDGLSVIEYKKENPETALIFQANHYDKVVRNLKNKKREKVASDAPKSEIERLDEKITFNMKKFNELVKKKEDSAQQ